ncbi:hypothetical protein KQH42_07145 [Streptomyces sp. CHA1]|uniref:hypothetical protein n=1 Tax=Streptomyces TaxID=1883 RepID=UPI001BFCA65B|nr:MULTISPECIES: hypothetical protein [unclassified Streptomyces]MBT3157385.1 hypothetical protein [Streptomyces sp. G11C]MCO6700290.1 hypothetical protein [Streptomyces sp. CHB9.2]MCO6706425.1 hypothetical protein [Streptomyces sp. CHA3]MCO6712168.1 hypothetical protein [Streptomyces sp. CHB19.2]MCO6718602.1 hypothetical protein [Streptomyces sp. Vc714c-19]
MIRLVARRILMPSIAAVAVGAVIGLVGVLLDSLSIWRFGLLLTVAAIPLLCYSLIYRALQASDDQLAATHRAGYQLALFHVAEGLLGPIAPPDGGEDVGHSVTHQAGARDYLPDNVRPLRDRGNEEDDNRKAI